MLDNMITDIIFKNTSNEFKGLITEIQDDKLLLSSLCSYLKTKQSIETVIYQSSDTERIVLFETTSVDNIENINKFNELNVEEFIMFDNKYGIVFRTLNSNLEITNEYLNYLTTTLILIVKNIVINKNNDIESSIKDVKNVLNKLSFTELTVILKIFEENKDDEFTVVASNVAQKYGFTRSSIVNALRKLESAMIIESYSLGVKGTHIKIINNYFRQEINKLN